MQIALVAVEKQEHLRTCLFFLIEVQHSYKLQSSKQKYRPIYLEPFLI